MATFYYYVSGKNFDERGEFTPIEADSEDISWIHVVEPKDGEVEAAVAHLDASEALVEMITDAQLHPEVLVREGAGAVTFPVQMPGDWGREYLTMVVRGRTLVTATRVAIPYIEKFRRHAVEKGAESALNPMAELLDECGRADRSALTAMRAAIDVLDERLDEAPEKISFTEIRALKRAIVTCGHICEDQAFCLAALDAPAVKEISTGSRAPMRESMLTLVRYIDRAFDRLDVRARELESQLQVVYQKRTEDRLRVLTVISAIFMPLTLIAGIYGMNFVSMPELNEAWAYQICLGGMTAVALGMLFWFYRRGWLAPSR